MREYGHQAVVSRPRSTRSSRSSCSRRARGTGPGVLGPEAFPAGRSSSGWPPRRGARDGREERRRCRLASGSGLTERVRTERERYVARGVSTSPLVVARAEGARVWDAEGREYLDFAGGIGCQNLGHGLPAVVEAIHEQVDRFLHQCFMVGMYEPYVEVCRRLAESRPAAETSRRACS